MKQTTTTSIAAHTNKVAVALKVNTGVKAGIGGRESPPAGLNNNQTMVRANKVSVAFTLIRKEKKDMKVKTNVKAGLIGLL